MNNLNQLIISDLRLWVHLGCSEHEKAQPQPVSIDITIYLPNTFTQQSMKTDNINHTVCYFNLIKAIKKNITRHQPFNLIESLTGCIYASVYHDLLKLKQPDIILEIKLAKLSPPIADLHGGTVFIYKDSLQQGQKNDLYQHWF